MNGLAAQEEGGEQLVVLAQLQVAEGGPLRRFVYDPLTRAPRPNDILDNLPEVRLLCCFFLGFQQITFFLGFSWVFDREARLVPILMHSLAGKMGSFTGFERDQGSNTLCAMQFLS